MPCTIRDTFVQKTRYAQNFWKNVCGRNGIAWDSSFSFRKRLTGQGLLRDSLTPLYVPVFVLAPVLALLFSSSPGTIIGWSPRLPWAWMVQYLLIQSVVLFNVARVALGPAAGREQRTSRSLVASWLTNLTSTHTFWFMISLSAVKVLRAELKGSMLEFVVTPKTQSAREEEEGEQQQAGGAPLSSSTPSVAALPGVAASIAARPSLYPEEYFPDGRRKSVLLPQATAAAAGLARRASVALAVAASGFVGGGLGSGRRASTVSGRRSSVSPVMLEASIDRCQSLARVMMLHVQDEQARKKKGEAGSQKGAKSTAAEPASSSSAKKAPSPLQSSFGALRMRQQGNDGSSAAPAVKTPFCVDSPFNAADGAAAAAAPAANANAAAGPLSSERGDGASKAIETLFSGGGASVEWRRVLAARRQAELQANAKKLRRWTSSLRIVHRPERGGGAEGGAEGDDAAAVAPFEEGEPVPWEHVWVHALAGGLSLLAFVSGVCKLVLGSVRSAKLPAAASASSFFAWRRAAPASAASLLPAPQLIFFTAWAFINAVPPFLLFVRTVKGDGPTLQRWWAVAQRAVLSVAGLALAGVLAASVQ